jgi:hypothetical protein
MCVAVKKKEHALLFLYSLHLLHRALSLARQDTNTTKIWSMQLGRREKDNPNPNPNLLLAALKIEAEHSFNPPKFNTANPCMR